MSTDDDSIIPHLNIPADVWALILTDLPIHILMKVVIGNRFFMRVLQMLPRLTITRKDDIDVPTARKVLKMNIIQEIYIRSLVYAPTVADVGDDWLGELPMQALCIGTANRIVPFLSLFPCVNKIHLGGEQQRIPGQVSSGVEKYMRPLCGIPEDHYEYFHGLLWSMCGAFASRALPGNLDMTSWLDDITCLWNEDNSGVDNCTFCKFILKNFPVRCIIECLNLNLCGNEDEWMQIVLSRPDISASELQSRELWVNLVSQFSVYQYGQQNTVASDYPPSYIRRLKVLLERGYKSNFQDDFWCRLICDTINDQPITRRAFHFLENDVGAKISESECCINIIDTNEESSMSDSNAGDIIDANEDISMSDSDSENTVST